MRSISRFVCALALCAASVAGSPANALPAAQREIIASPLTQQIVYRRHVHRRHYAHAYRGRRVYRRNGYDPGPAILGAMVGIIGAGIAASQEPAYGYGYPYGYGGYGSPYGYGGYGNPYGGW